MNSLGDVDILNNVSDKSHESTELKRRRSDKISNLMGRYLLKGWRMLNVSCPECETILFQQPSGQYYCGSLFEPPHKNEDDLTTPHIQSCTGASKKPAEQSELLTNKQASIEKHKENNLISKLHGKINWCMSQMVEATSPTEIRQWTDTLKSLLDLWDKMFKCSILKS
ncbi:unnamed protein product [Heterobilharzia americana]|nr:unnamed protein product [Heterobilharzia americana]